MAPVLAVLVVLLLAAAPAAARERAVLRGVDDPRVFWAKPDAGEEAIVDIAQNLRADVIRADISWASAEPERGQYNDVYLDRVAARVATARAQGLQVVVLVYKTPYWASDRALWDTPMPGDPPGHYQSYFPPRVDRLPDYQAFAAHLATKLLGNVLAYEAWCEPNLWVYIYPQRTAADDAFAVRRYSLMLRAFSAGIRGADPQARVVAGSTAPFGRNDRYGTAPQRFARVLRALGAAASFDVYSHHPYVPGGTRDERPDAPPADLRHTVTLGNIGVLLDVFPGKPFYITEFGYSTHYSIVMGVTVTAAQQARYLRRSFRIMARYAQIEMGIWYLYHDLAANDSYSDRWGLYGGLRSLGGTRKPGYFAFAGGNTLTLAAPGSLDRGDPLRLRGKLTNATLGPLGERSLQVMGRRPGRRWVIVDTVRTRSDGTYSIWMGRATTAMWRVRWSGVVVSPERWVPVR